MTITKENYRDIVWDESRMGKEYYDFVETLNVEEKVDFLKFILEQYPGFDEEWIEYYFELSDKWVNAGEYEKLIDFADFVRTKSPAAYKKEFQYLDGTPVLHALFFDDLEQVKVRFEESILQPDKAIDLCLRNVFNSISTDRKYYDYAKETAERVWKPLETSDRLVGGAEFDYSAFLYCSILESTFDKIRQGETVDWEVFKSEVEEINFKYIDELLLLPNGDVVIEEEDKFHKNETYRQEITPKMLLPFMYYAYTEAGIPAYWAFRSWFTIQRYMLEEEDAPKRSNWFAFTPKMIDKMGGDLNGFLGGNTAEMVITMYSVPYLYDYFLKQQYIDEPTYTRLMEYYEFPRREILRILGSDFWRYKGLYTWDKPNYLTKERYEKERSLMMESINWTHKEGKEIMKTYRENLPDLPDYVTPPSPDPSPLERMMQEHNPFPLAPVRKKRSSKNRKKKKHKDNRKRGAKNKKRK